jgi:hypothetical protein
MKTIKTIFTILAILFVIGLVIGKEERQALPNLFKEMCRFVEILSTKLSGRKLPVSKPEPRFHQENGVYVGTAGKDRDLILWIGLNKNEVLSIMNRQPDHINQMTTQRGTLEQWVYERVYEMHGDHIHTKTVYLYFENGLLTGIQQ